MAAAARGGYVDLMPAICGGQTTATGGGYIDGMAAICGGYFVAVVHHLDGGPMSCEPVDADVEMRRVFLPAPGRLDSFVGF